MISKRGKLRIGKFVKLIAPTPKPVAVTAIHANAGVRVEYERCLQDAIRAMHDSMSLHILAAWRATPPITGFAQDDANSAVVLRRTLKKWGDRWISKFNDLSSTLAMRFANKSFKHTQVSMLAAFKRAGFTVAFKPTAASVESYKAVIAENVGLIKSIPAQYLKDVQTSVWQSVMRGGDMDTLSRDLVKNYGVSYKRAALISRDQNNKAKATLENTRRRELGITQARWQHSGGGRVPRPTHVAMNGKIFDLKRGMYDSHEGRNVFPGELISCRCSSRAIIPGLNND